MELPETAALRHFVDQYLAGHETSETVAPAYIMLVAAYYEANFQATRRGEPVQADYL
jgi:hypothetical protein